jgi:hypothetical protein
VNGDARRLSLTVSAHPSLIFVRTTAPTPGAIAIVQVMGDECERILREITGVDDWPIGRMRLADLAGVDDGLAAR